MFLSHRAEWISIEEWQCGCTDHHLDRNDDGLNQASIGDLCKGQWTFNSAEWLSSSSRFEFEFTWTRVFARSSTNEILRSRECSSFSKTNFTLSRTSDLVSSSNWFSFDQEISHLHQTFLNFPRKIKEWQGEEEKRKKNIHWKGRSMNADQWALTFVQRNIRRVSFNARSSFVVSLRRWFYSIDVNASSSHVWKSVFALQ